MDRDHSKASTYYVLGKFCLFLWSIKYFVASRAWGGIWAVQNEMPSTQTKNPGEATKHKRQSVHPTLPLFPTITSLPHNFRCQNASKRLSPVHLLHSLPVPSRTGNSSLLLCERWNKMNWSHCKHAKNTELLHGRGKWCQWLYLKF